MADVYALLDTWIEHVKDPELLAELTKLKEDGDTGAITDAFFQDLEFGTAGLRGTIGAGTNRMNIYTVGRATQGFADYLNQTFDNPTVAIARDSRNKGELFVKTTGVYSGCQRRDVLHLPQDFACAHPFLGDALPQLFGRHLHDGKP